MKRMCIPIELISHPIYKFTSCFKVNIQYGIRSNLIAKFIIVLADNELFYYDITRHYQLVPIRNDSSFSIDVIRQYNELIRNENLLIKALYYAKYLNILPEIRGVIIEFIHLICI